MERKLDGAHGRMAHLFKLQSGGMASIGAGLEMQARRSEETMKDMQGHLANIYLARRKDMQRMEAVLHEMDMRIKNIDKSRQVPDNAALKEITGRLNRLETGDKTNNYDSNSTAITSIGQPRTELWECGRQTLTETRS